MKLTIDNRAVEAAAGETVLTAALRHGIAIPHLCTHPILPPYGACRMCLVEIDGLRGYPASCSTPAAEGMVVQTQTQALRELRRGILELMLLEHPSACLVCDKSELCERYRPKAEKAGRTTGCHTCNNKESCEVKELAHELGIESLPVAPAYRTLPIERTDPFIDRDLNLCILCGRCVRICKAHHGESTIDFIGRGHDARIGEAFGRSLTEAGCRFCGACVDVCPTGSLSDRYAKWHGRPDATVETTCILCEAACALRLESNRGKLTGARPAQQNVPICVLGRFAIPELLNGGARLRAPRVRVGRVLREMRWEEALPKVAEMLAPFKGAAFAVVCDTTSTVEDRHVLRRLAVEAMGSAHYIELHPDAQGRARADLPAGVRAVLTTGDFLTEEQRAGLETLVIQDLYPTAASEAAQAALPAAAFAEVDGTWLDGAGQPRPLKQAGRAPGQAWPDWRIAAELGRALGAGGFQYESAAAVAAEAGIGAALPIADRRGAPAPAHDPSLRNTTFRGHPLAEKVRGLRTLPTAVGTAAVAAVGG